MSTSTWAPAETRVAGSRATAPSRRTLPVSHSLRTSFQLAPSNTWIQVVPTFQATTQGFPLMFQLTVPAQSFGQSNQLTCQATVDGFWAGHSAYPGVPATDTAHEGWITLSPIYGVWNSTRIFDKIVAGQHSFGIQCLSPNSTPLLGSPTGAIASLISLNVIELR